MRSTRIARTLLVSVIVPVYNVEKYVEKCFDSILTQTYQNIELIVVNDCSPGNIKQIFAKYSKRFENAKLVDLPKNGGLFRARVKGVKAASGKYVIFIDGDDYVSSDYIRLLVNQAEKESADIVMSTTVIEEENGRRFVYNLANELPFETLSGEDIFAKFVGQRGKNFMWHIIHSKLFSRALWMNSLDFLDKIDERIVMCEDVLNSFVLWSKARKVARAKTANYFYVQWQNSSTNHFTVDTVTRNIADVQKVFGHVDDYLASNHLLNEQIEDDLGYWHDAYAKMWSRAVDGLRVRGGVKKKLREEVESLARHDNYDQMGVDDFYSVQTDFNDGLDKIKLQISHAKVVSFDIFDTLIQRPFLEPNQLFRLLDREFRAKTGGKFLNDFRDLRIMAEIGARNKSELEEVTLDEIYDNLVDGLEIDRILADYMKNREIELEERYCSSRKTGAELYQFAKYLGKRVIITSDMYLPREVIGKILADNGFDDYEQLFLSSELKIGKSTGSLFYYVHNKIGCKARDIVHVDDNGYVLDAAKSCGFKVSHLPKASEVFERYGLVVKIFGAYNAYVKSFFGYQVALGVVANKVFDNPFTSFNSESIFNCSPVVVGYYALGLSMFTMTKWMVENLSKDKIDSIVFLARDGYMPEQIFQNFARKIDLKVNVSYLPTSRKAILPLTANNKGKLRDTLESFSAHQSRISASIVRAFNCVENESAGDKMLRDWSRAKGLRGVDSEMATQIISTSINYSAAQKLRHAFANTYKDMFSGRTAVFDIGYSGKPEQIFSGIFKKDLDTYFMYINQDEPMRRLGDRLHYFSRFSKIGIRELMVSAQTASCTGYEIVDGKVVPTFSGFAKSYSETFVIDQLQEGAL